MEYGLRDVYESYTKRVRFETYKVASGDHMPNVLLGHNRDDTIENVITNITYCSKYDNLTGMEKISEQDGVYVCRPMLDVPKTEIRLFAKEAGIPHFHDSTPSWSQRGKIRDSIIPALSSWDARSIPGLLELSYVVKEMYGIAQVQVQHMLSSTVGNTLTLIKEGCPNSHII